VRNDSTIADLHDTVQMAMGWTDSHLNRFIIHGKQYGVSHIGGTPFSDNPETVRLSAFRFRVRERLRYEYDFSGGWQHDIRVERTWPVEPKRPYPTCIGGRRASPPEDWGGLWACMAFKQQDSWVYLAGRVAEIVEEADGDLEDDCEELEVLACWASVERFDRRQANHWLKQYGVGDDERMWEWV
jgi:hypothetical protein